MGAGPLARGWPIEVDHNRTPFRELEAAFSRGLLRPGGAVSRSLAQGATRSLGSAKLWQGHRLIGLFFLITVTWHTLCYVRFFAITEVTAFQYY